MNTSKRIMIIIGILLIVGFVTMMIIDSRTAPNALEFEPLEPQLSLLDRVYPEWFGDKIDILSLEQGKQVTCDWYRYKGLAALNDTSLNEAAEQFNANSMDLVAATSIGASYWTSELVFDELTAIYQGDKAVRDAVISRCVEDNPDIDKHLAADTDAFYSFAGPEGLVDDKHAISADARRYLRLIHRHLWNGVSSEQFLITRLEPPEEALAFLRWQIEKSQMPFERKLQKINKSEEYAFIQYDYNFARAVLYVQNGLLEDACTILKHAYEITDSQNTFRRNRYQNAIKELARSHSIACQL